MILHSKVIKLTEEWNTLEVVVNNLITRNNNRIVPSLTPHERENISDEEKTLYSTWLINDSIGSPILESDFHSEADDVLERSTANIRFLVRSASVEYSRHKKRDNNGVLLPKEVRVGIENINVIFFERNNSVFIIICTIPNHYNKVKQLIGEANLDEENSDYQITSNEFLWLFYKYSTHQNNLSESLQISNITSFTGNIFDENHVITGASDVTSSLVVTKAFVSCGYPFTKMRVSMHSRGYMLNFLIDENSNLSIDTESEFLHQQDVTIMMPLYIISIIIPMIHEFYNIENFERNIVREDFLKRIGIDVITEIITSNNISIEELNLLDCIHRV